MRKSSVRDKQQLLRLPSKGTQTPRLLREKSPSLHSLPSVPSHESRFSPRQDFHHDLPHRNSAPCPLPQNQLGGILPSLSASNLPRQFFPVSPSQSPRSSPRQSPRTSYFHSNHPPLPSPSTFSPRSLRSSIYPRTSPRSLPSHCIAPSCSSPYSSCSVNRCPSNSPIPPSSLKLRADPRFYNCSAPLPPSPLTVEPIPSSPPPSCVPPICLSSPPPLSPPPFPSYSFSSPSTYVSYITSSEEEAESSDGDNITPPYCILPFSCRRPRSRCLTSSGCCSGDVWTSRDLRDYLVRQARERLGGPRHNRTPSVSNESGHRDSNRVHCKVNSKPSSPRKPKSFLGPRGSLQLDRVCEWYVPRARLWSLPAIIVTQWDTFRSDPGENAGADGDDGIPPEQCPQFLTVPNKHKLLMRRSSSCSNLPRLENEEEEEEPTLQNQQSELQLGSILALWPARDERDDDEDSEPRSAADVLTYETSYVSTP